MSTYLIHLLSLCIGTLAMYLVYAVDSRYIALCAGLQLVLFGCFYVLTLVSTRFAKIIYTPCISLIIVAAVIHADNFTTYGPLLRETIDAIFQTTNKEATSYLMFFSSDLIVPVGMAYLGVTWLSLYRLRVDQWNLAVPLLAITVGCLLVYFGRALPISVYTTAQDYREKMTAFSSSRIRLLGELGTVTAQTDVNVILILGESTARQHLSVYGYPRKTTPFLDSLDNAVVYRDIISSHSHTNESLSRALTFNQRGSYSSFAGQLDLLSVANAAGVDTYWFSNQNTIGIWDNSVSVISAQAKESRYHDPSSGFRRTREIYDRALVVTLKELLHRSPTGSKLIVLHMMATHFPYCDVVPQDYLEHALVYDDPPMDERFFGAWIGSLASSMNERQLVTYFSSVNCYDRAVNYADSIVAEVIEYVQKLNTPTAVLYTADHGEAVIYNSGHESRMHSHLHVEVPFVFWHNPEFKNQIHLDPSRKASLEDLSYSIADLLSISGIDRVSQRSIFSEHYTEIPRKTLDGRVGYDVFDSRADSSERTRANLFTLNQSDFERVWAHRVNSGGTMMETKELFFGIEMDLVFEGSVFNVHHPPRPAVGLTLEMQLNQDRVGIEYWLDWKNASNENIDAAVARLEELDQSRKFKQRALVEISALDGSAQVLVENGWRTAYYLPTQRIGDCIRDCTEAEKKSLAVELWSNFDDGGFNAVSFDIVLLTFIDNHMLKRIRQERIPAYSWATEIDISLEDAPEKLEPLLKHGWINALLVTMPSHFRL